MQMCAQLPFAELISRWSNERKTRVRECETGGAQESRHCGWGTGAVEHGGQPGLSGKIPLFSRLR